MAYTKTVWNENAAPGISGAKLNKIEQGIYDAHENIQSIVNLQLPQEYLEAAIDSYVEENAAGLATKADAEDLDAKIDEVSGRLSSEIGNLESNVSEQIYFNKNVFDGKYVKHAYYSSTDGTLLLNKPAYVCTENMLSVNVGDILVFDECINSINIYLYNYNGNTLLGTDTLERPSKGVIHTVGENVNGVHVVWMFNSEEEAENPNVAIITKNPVATTKEQIDSLKGSVVEINKTLSNGFDITNCEFRETIELGNVIDGYVNSGGSAVTSGDTGGYAVTETPITLLKGETIYIYARCITNVALIATYKQSWYGMTTLLLGNGGDKQIYEYTPQENIDVVISFHKSSGCEVYRKTDGNDVIECVKVVKEFKTNVDFAKIFHKIGGIGDSLMSGEIARWTENGDEYIDRYNFSWLSNIARDIGAEYVHYSQGGMTAKAWLNDSGGYKTKLLAETDKCSAYFIGLCTNDWKQSYPLGTINDNAGSDSFVGYYKQIVETVKAHNPNAIIFLVSAYSNSEKGVLYSNMISEIAELYSNCYYIDFVNNTDIYTNDSVYANYSHFTTLGYVKVADTIHSLVNKTIKEYANTNFFKFFALNNE